MLPYSKPCEIEDFQDPELSRYITDIYSAEFDPALEDDAKVGDSKRWEVAMAVRALDAHGILSRDKRVLGVGAGLEITSYYLTRKVEAVFATDIYMNAGVWAYGAPLGMLVDPSRYAKIPYEVDRLLAMHMDARRMRFPDNFFDGVYSSGSIEHVGSLDFVSNCAFEIGRVLKKGGLATLATEYKLAGPNEGIGWDPNVILFNVENLKKYIIEASGLRMVGEGNFKISEKTLALSQPLLDFLGKVDRKTTAIKRSEAYPNLVLTHEGYAFGSVHLALYKPLDYVAGASMEFARPSEELVKKIAEEDASRLDALLEAGKKSSSAAPAAQAQQSGAIIEDMGNAAPTLTRVSAADSRLHTLAGKKVDSAIVITDSSSGVGLYGPYLEAPPGAYIATLFFVPDAEKKGRAKINFAIGGGTKVLAEKSVDLSQVSGSSIQLYFTSDSPLDKWEFRLFCEKDVNAKIRGIELASVTGLRRLWAACCAYFTKG